MAVAKVAQRKQTTPRYRAVARVARGSKRRRGGFWGFDAWRTAVLESPGVANYAAERFRVLRAGKRQSWTPVKADGWQWPKVYGCGQIWLWPESFGVANYAAERFRVLRAGKRQSWTPVKTDGVAQGIWLWPASPGAANDAAEGFRVLTPGERQSWTPVKNRWLAVAQSIWLWPESPGVANYAAEGFRVLTPGKRQSWTPVKTDGWQWPKVCGCGQSRSWQLPQIRPWQKLTFQTSGVPRRRPCLGIGRGRRIQFRSL